MKRILSHLCALALLVSVLGCQSSRLEPGGAYAPVDAQGAALAQPDMALFTADSAFKLAYTGIDLVFAFERDNRAMLKALSPDIKATIDIVRPQAVACRNAYAKARTTYIANPTPAGLDRLNSVISKIQQLTLTAQAVLPKPN